MEITLLYKLSEKNIPIIIFKRYEKQTNQFELTFTSGGSNASCCFFSFFFNNIFTI